MDKKKKDKRTNSKEQYYSANPMSVQSQLLSVQSQLLSMQNQLLSLQSQLLYVQSQLLSIQDLRLVVIRKYMFIFILVKIVKLCRM